MKMVVGYDRDLARACFKRNLIQLIRPGSGASDISRSEIDYVSDWLADSSVFGNYRKLGTTWTADTFADLTSLAEIPARRLSSQETWRLETGANNILTVAGLIERAGAVRRTDVRRSEGDKARTALAMILYAKTAHSRFVDPSRRRLLLNLSFHALDWIRYLSHLPGNDYLDLLAQNPRSQFVS